MLALLSSKVEKRSFMSSPVLRRCNALIPNDPSLNRQEVNDLIDAICKDNFDAVSKIVEANPNSAIEKHLISGRNAMDVKMSNQMRAFLEEKITRLLPRIQA